MAIGTTAALIGASVAGSAIQAGAASKAAKGQKQAAQSQLALQERIYEEQKDTLSPFLGAGGNALNALAYELGLGDRPTFGGTAPEVVEFQDTGPSQAFRSGPLGGLDRGDRENLGISRAFSSGPSRVSRYRVGDQVFNSIEAAQAYADANKTGGSEFQGFQKTPGYDFQLGEGINAIDRSAASRGGLFSGATMKAAQSFGQGLANQQYDTYLNRLTGLATSGQNAAALQGGAAQNFGAQGSNALADYGNASAAGAIGVGNALNAGIGNGIGVWQYMNQTQKPGGNANIFSTPWAAPGFWN